jgi:hypothetical protein
MESHAVAYLSQAPMRSEGLRTTKAFLACEGQALLVERLAVLIKLFHPFVKFLGPKKFFGRLPYKHISIKKNPRKSNPSLSFLRPKLGTLSCNCV